MGSIDYLVELTNNLHTVYTIAPMTFDIKLLKLSMSVSMVIRP